jgi:hypothetical protein
MFTHALRSLIRLVFVFGSLGAGCTPTEIEVGARDPANPTAPVASLAPVGAALAPGFDPQSSEATDHGAHSHSGHGMGHGAPGGSPSSEHAGHAQQPDHAGNVNPAAGAWTCPMHPEVRKLEPGNCPICGMKLEPAAPSKPDGGTP